MDNTEVNVPLLRKAVEWAEVEAAKPPELCEWRQVYWVTPATDAERAGWGQWATAVTTTELGKAPECGTCYCIAGYVVATQLGPVEESVEIAARELLGLNERDGEYLFRATNSIEDVRRIAEEIAGEPL